MLVKKSCLSELLIVEKRGEMIVLVLIEHSAMIENLEVLLERPNIDNVSYGSVIDLLIGVTMKTFIEMEY